MLPKRYFLLVRMLFVFDSGKGAIEQIYEDNKFNLIRDIYALNGNEKGWTNFLAMGNFSDSFFMTMQGLPLTFLTANAIYKAHTVAENLRYPLNTFVIECEDYKDFSRKFKIVMSNPYWHPHSKTIIYYRGEAESDEIIAKSFFAIRYYRGHNAIILQHDSNSNMWKVTNFNSFLSEDHTVGNIYGCWTFKKLSFRVTDFQKGLVCIKGCQNVTLLSQKRAEHLGTCIELETNIIRFDDKREIQKLFADRTKNFNGYTMRSLALEVRPFLTIDEYGNRTYYISGRDGKIWNTMAERMNFKMDFSASGENIKNSFDYELSVQYIVDFSRRKADLLILPIYQIDLVVVELDMTVAFTDSGVCFLSQRAGFETTLIDLKSFRSNYTVLIEFLFCFLGTWAVFFVFNVVEKDVFNSDQVGKDLVNAIRSILSISLHRPPKKESFKIFLLVSIWSFFILNFVTQAAIISFFSAFKRGKDIDTFDDIAKKGYIIQGMASPDIVLPDTEEKFIKINALLKPMRHLLDCVNVLSNDSQRICLMDCSMGRYLVRNKLNEQGEQYLHIAKDQIHGHYLNMVLQKHSPLTDEFNRNMLLFLQAGLVNKWEQYRFANIKYEAPVKSLNMSDLIGIFKCYSALAVLSIMVFVLEVSLGSKRGMKIFCEVKLCKWFRKRSRL